MTELAREIIAEHAERTLNLTVQDSLCVQALGELRVVHDEDEPLPTPDDIADSLRRQDVVRAWSRMHDAPRPMLINAPRFRGVGVGPAPDEELAVHGYAPVSPHRLAAAFNDRDQDLWDPEELFSWDALWNKYSLRVLNNGRAAVGWSTILLFTDTHDPQDPDLELPVQGLVYEGLAATEQRRALAAERIHYGEALDVATAAEIIVAHAVERVLLRRDTPPPPDTTHMPEPKESQQAHDSVKQHGPRPPRITPPPPPEVLLPNSCTVFPQYGARRPDAASKPMVPAVCLEDGHLRLSGFPGRSRGGGGIRRGIRLA